MTYQRVDDLLTTYLIPHIENLWDTLNPINAVEEKLKCFKFLEKGDIYQPVLQYKGLPADFSSIEKTLNSVKVRDDRLGQIFIDKINELKKEIRLLSNKGHDTFSQISSELYGLPSQSVLKEAYAILEKSTSEFYEPETVSSEQLKAIIEKELETNEFFNWSTKLDQLISSKVSVVSAQRKICIKKDVNFTSHEVARLKVHEIWTHILRAENGYSQPYHIFGHGLANYVGTEEGLAVYNEEKAGLLNTTFLKIYAGRTIAVKLAQETSFWDVFSKLLSYFSPEAAYTITLRSKRGLINTVEPGGFTKDHLYLSGYFYVKGYFSNNNPPKLLYVGKVGIEDVNLIKQLLEEEILQQPSKLPKFYN